jgi:hypothetical protein
MANYLYTHILYKIFYKEENTMTMKSIKTHTRLLTCLVVLAVVFATFLSGTFTSQASEDVFGDIELKVGDTLGFVYYTSQPYTENTKMRFTINGRTSESPAYPNDGKCVFIFNDIYPHELAKEVTATIIVNNQETVSSEGLSVKSYLLQMLMNPKSTAAECQFASDTLQYGEQTRLYRNANVAIADRDNESITDDINTSIYTKYTPRDIESVMAGTAQGLGVSSYSAVRMSSIGISYHNVNKYVVTLQFAPGAHISPQNIKVKIGDTTYAMGSENVVDNGDGTWTITSDGISAYNFFENNTTLDIPVQLSVNNKVVQQATYNIKDYVCQLQDTTQSGSLAVKYARSLYRYAQSAEAAYKGNRIVAISLNSNPDNVVPGSKGAQTPGGGSIIAYYSDGSHKQINEGIVWPNKDIHGNNVAITDDTHTKTFDILGSYTDPVSKKVYTVSAQVTLHNDMTGIERWTDPDIYDCKSYVASYTPTNGLVRCTWSNGYQANRAPTYTAINMADYKEDEYGFIPVTASYTDPKSGENDTVTMYVLYKNPITAITIANTTANYNDGTIDNATTPHASTYTVTYQNGAVSAAKNTGSTWNSTIQNGGSTQTKSYSFTWTNLTSTSTEYRISFTQTANGTLNRPGYGTWTRKANGGNATFTANNGTTDDSCTATVTNPEYQLTLSSAPYVHGSTVKSASNLTGSQNSTTAGQWRGGTVTMKYCNGAVEDVTASVTYSSPSITNTAYSKKVTVTATYTKKAGGTATATKADVTIYNYLSSISQSKVPSIYATTAKNAQLKLTDTTHTITATYANGKTEVVGVGDTTDTNIYLGSTIRNTACFVPNPTAARVETVQHTTATTTAAGTSYSSIIIKYDDYRTTTTYTGSVKEISGYKVDVVNGYSSITTTKVDNVYMSGTTVSAPTTKVTVQLNNGTTISVTPTYTTPAAITDATEYVDRTITATCKDTYGKTVTKSVTCRVINKAKSATNKANPNAVTVTNTSKVTSLSGGKLTVTFENGKTADLACTSYTIPDTAKITDTTTLKSLTITGVWSGAYSSASASQTLTLKNPASSATLTNMSVVLSTGAVTPSSTLTVKHSNGQTKGYTVNCTAVQPTGTTSTGTATTDESGSCTVSASKTVDGVKVSDSATCSWTNPVTSLADQKKAYRNCATAGNTLTLSNDYVYDRYATATLQNGATKTVTVSIYYDKDVANVTGTTYTNYKYVSASYGGKTISNFQVKVYNPLSSISVTDKAASFSSDTASISSITATATYRNGESKYNVKPTLSVVSTQAGTASVSGTTVSCKYTGTSEVTFTSTYRASFKENGVTKTDDFIVTWTNAFTVTIMVVDDDGNTSEASYSTGKSQSSYPSIRFNSGSTTTITNTSVSVKVSFYNGQTTYKNYNSSGVSFTQNGSSWTHNQKSLFLNGNSFSAYTSGSLRTAKCTVTIDGVSKTDYSYAIPRTGCDLAYYTSEEIKCNCTGGSNGGCPDGHHVRQGCWKSWLSGSQYFHNGLTLTTATAAYYKVAAENSNYGYYFGTNGSWGNYSSSNRSASSAILNMYNTSGPHSGYKWRTDFYGQGWLGDDGYLVLTYPASMTFNSITHTAKNATQRKSWASSLEFMGY